ncbi:MAG: ATP-binding protein [Lachnospiraceae bacterium]
MRLIRCHIQNFGKLQNCSFDFTGGENIFCKDNGWGKSTLAAFIRVMLYGFEGERKRNILENERKRYQPWQGGVYGGELTFEVGDRQYRVSRIFKDKEANDEFELRDGKTNLLSTDYSRNLGRELFQIDGASFMRSAFIGQNDCITNVTDDINAKIGNPDRNINDINHFEAAYRQLTDLINAMTPNRKTGSLSKLQDDITGLEREVKEGKKLEASIRDSLEMLDDEKRKKQENQKEQREIIREQKLSAQYQDALIKKEAWEKLCLDEKEKRKTLLELQKRFPKDLPEEAEVAFCMEMCRKLMKSEERARMNRLTKEEAAKLKAFRTEKNAGSPKAVRRNGRKSRKRLPVFVIVGILLAVQGIITAGKMLIPGICLIAAGFAAVSFGVYVTGRNASDNRKQESPEMEEMREELFCTLKNRKREYESALRECHDCRENIGSFLDRYGLSADTDLMDTLLEIRKNLNEYQLAENYWKTAAAEKKDYEQKNDMSAILTGLPESGLSTMQELNDRFSELDGKNQRITDRINELKIRYDRLLQAYDEWTEKKEILEEKKREYEAGYRKFLRLEQTRKYLCAARESLTSKYMGPICAGFQKYYEMIDRNGGNTYEIDANSHITVYEKGRQRETDTLSTGYQDLTGLALRIALVDAMYQGEAPFLILDDPFVNLDEEKTVAARRFLKEISGKYQVIYFTCHSSRA